jgi:hypothetical protein
MTEHHASHGNSPAAWTAVIVIMVGSLVSSFAVWFSQPWLFFTGLGICVLGLIAGKVMAMMGFGVDRPEAAPNGADATAPAAPAAHPSDA